MESLTAPRCLSTRTAGGVLLDAFPGMPPNDFVDCTSVAATEITKMSNGVTVASEDIAGPWCAVSAIVGVGPRFEVGNSSGVTHFLDRLAYKSTAKFSHTDIMDQLQKLGGNFLCTTNRETIMYQGMVFLQDLEQTMELLAEVAVHAQYTEEEIAEQRQMVAWELESITDRAEVFLPELLHRAAYGSGTLGNAHICNQELADEMSSARICEFRDQYYVAPRMVIAGAGMKHDVLLELSEKYFGGVSSGSATPIVDEPAEYLGGCRLYPMEVSPSNNAQGIPLTQLGLGFKGIGWADEDIYPVAVLQLLLGGGLSFSVGGPGKGMFSRMYNNVMNLNHWAEMALAMNLSYMDSGIFYIQGAAPPQKIQVLLDILLKEMMSVAHGVSEMEVSRAQNQLKASLLMNLESKSITAEDIGRQVLGFGYRLSSDDLIEKIDAVTAADVSRVTTTMLQSYPTLAAYGNVEKLTDYESLVSSLQRHMG